MLIDFQNFFNVPERSENEGWISNLRSNRPNYHSWNLIKIGAVDPEIIVSKVYLKKKKWWGVRLSVSSTPELLDGILPNFLHDVTRSFQMNLLKPELWYSTPFWNAKATNVRELADFANFHPKIGCHTTTTSIDDGEKEGRSIIYDQIPSIWWKFKSSDNWSPRNH